MAAGGCPGRLLPLLPLLLLVLLVLLALLRPGRAAAAEMEFSPNFSHLKDSFRQQLSSPQRTADTCRILPSSEKRHLKRQNELFRTSCQVPVWSQGKETDTINCVGKEGRYLIPDTLVLADKDR